MAFGRHFSCQMSGKVRTFRPAGLAEQRRQFAMDLDQPLRRRTRLAVVAVDVLRQHPALRLELLQLRDGFVTGVRPGTEAGAAKLGEVFPAECRIAPQHRAGKRFLYRQTLFRHAVVETAQAPVGGQPRVGRKPGPGDHQDSFGSLQHCRYALDIRHDSSPCSARRPVSARGNGRRNRRLSG
ncbi:hypothetical protein D9M71_549420 [compost metagenome]